MTHATTSLAPDPAKIRRIELILRQIDSLPTLPVIATKLLALTTDDQAETRQIVELISSDQALTSKILGVCRRADLGIREEIATVDKAVVLLGFNAVRNAVLSIKVYEMFAVGQRVESRSAGQADVLGEENCPPSPVFDRIGLWRHCLAVAIASERLALILNQRELPPGEAFVCGLLHDLGKLALDHVLPRSYGRVIELVDLNQGNIAEFERRIIGMDHHTAGKRLAEQWHLPYVIQDCIWLHGSNYEMLPRLEHRRMIGLVSLADLIARRLHLGYSGNFTFLQDEAALAKSLNINPASLADLGQHLHQELERRSQTLGLDEQPSPELYLKSIQQANQMLGRLNSTLERRGRAAARQAQVLDAISVFHAAASPGRSVEDVLNSVITSATAVLGAGYYGLIYQAGPGDPWLVCQYTQEDSRATHSQIVEPPDTCPDLSCLDASQPATLNLLGFMPWIADYLIHARELREVRLLPLGCGWGTAAILLHDRPALPPWPQLLAITSTWGSAIAATGQHDGARRLGEQLAEANRALAQTQDRLLQAQSLARVGELAAGAAHEMNNPLAVISGRAQLLAQSAPASSKEQQAAQTIIEQAHRLSDLISALRLYSQPPKSNPQSVDLAQVLDLAIQQAKKEASMPAKCPPIQVQIADDPIRVRLDVQLTCQALVQLILNAAQAHPRTGVVLQAAQDLTHKRLTIQVHDDGVGMEPNVLAHAMDPFFSAKPAGRQLGMGLPRAKQLVEAQTGGIELRSQPEKGTTAILWLPLESPS